MDMQIYGPLLAVFHIGVSLGCSKLTGQSLVFDICQTDVEIINGSSSGYLLVHVHPQLLDCNCTLSTIVPDFLILGLIVNGHFSHSVHVTAGANTKISVHSGVISRGIGSGTIEKAAPWQINMTKLYATQASSFASSNESICLGYSTKKNDLVIKCRSSFLRALLAGPTVTENITQFLVIAVPVLLLLLLILITVSFVCYKTSRHHGDHQLMKAHVHQDIELTGVPNVNKTGEISWTYDDKSNNYT